MSWIDRLLHRSVLNSQLDAELNFHIDRLAQDLEREGRSPEDARREALRRFGGATQVAEECRESWGTARIESITQDLKHALRVFAKAPSATIPAVLALALAIGASTVIFSAVYALLLKPLPYPDESGLFMLFGSIPSQERTAFSTREFELWRSAEHSFSSLGAYVGNGITMKGRGEPAALFGIMATGEVFDALKVSAARGRTIRESDCRPGKDHVVLLSDRLWREKFNADAGAVGQTVFLNGEVYTIVGVMPSSFVFPEARYQLWIPATLGSGLFQKFPDAHFLRTLARLRPGVSDSQLAAETDILRRRLAELDQDPRRAVRIVSLPEAVRGPVRRPLTMLLAAVLFILLIACANVASILLAHATGRYHEFALRAALGAGRVRLIQQLAIESTVVAGLGGAVGIVLSIALVGVLRRFASESLPRAENVTVNVPVLIFAAGLSLLSGVLFGIVPAILAARRAGSEGPGHGARGTSDRSSRRVLAALVSLEAALSVVLVAGAGLFAHSFFKLTSTSPGFRPDHVLSASVSLDEKAYPEAANILRYVRMSLEQARTIPGVDGAAIATHMPFSGQEWGNSYEVEGHPAPPGKGYVAQIRPVTPDLFRVMGIPVRAGEAFTDRDTAGRPGVAIINEAIARKFWPGDSPIGKRIRFDESWLTIRGVVGNIKHARLDADTDPEIYVPFEQLPPNLIKFLGRGPMLVIHGMLDESAMSSALRFALRTVDSGLAVRDVKPLEEMIADSVAAPRFRTSLLTGFSLIALILSGIGIYGIMAYLVAQRVPEIGIRMALGAPRAAILRMVLAQTVRVSAIGVAAGVVAAAFLVRTVQNLLFGIPEHDPLVFILAPVLIMVVAVLASAVPAQSAAQADPLVSLRTE